LFVSESKSETEIIRDIVRGDGPLLTERYLGGQMMEPQDKVEVVRLTTRLFNEQRYWECHETMEAIWKKEEDSSEKNVQNGIILAASALVHAQKGEDDVCLNMVSRALEKLGRWEHNEYYELDVDSLKNYMKDILATHAIIYRKI